MSVFLFNMQFQYWTVSHSERVAFKPSTCTFPLSVTNTCFVLLMLTHPLSTHLSVKANTYKDMFLFNDKTCVRYTIQVKLKQGFCLPW